MAERIVIVGASLAGLSAAEMLRRCAFDGELVIVGAERRQPYDRPPLSKQLLAGERVADDLLLRKEPALRQLAATWRLGTRAVALDTGARAVTLEDGELVSFDGLLVATGVAPRHLPAGHELAGVHLLRTADDALALRATLAPPTRLVIVGAGFLGCEVAATARRLGMEVTVVDPLPLPLSAQLGSVVGAAVAELHSEHGVHVHSGVGVRGLAGGDGRVTEVALDDGSVLRADVVLVAIGSTPNTAWLEGSGLTVTDGVDCDEFCLAAPGVAAAGDVARWLHVGLGRRMRVEHRTHAVEQGAAAARALLGQTTEPFAPTPFFWTDQYDARIQVFGAIPPDASAELVAGEIAARKFVLAYRSEGQVAALLGWNMPLELLRLRQALLPAQVAVR